MKVLVMCGDHLRHIYYANTLMEQFEVAGLLVTKREEVPKHTPFMSEADKRLFEEYFRLRTQKEKEYFLPKGEHFLPKAEKKEVEMGQLNDPDTIEWVRKRDADVVMVYGTGLLKGELLDACPAYTINMHGGLSPWYRGAATLMYPTYFLQPQYSGITFHLVSKHVDGGPILQHVRPEIKADDTVHDVGCRAVVDASEVAVRLLKKLEREGSLQQYPQTTAGKIFYTDDFQPHHLRVLKMLQEQQFYAEYLKNKEKFREPKLVDQL